MAGETGKLLRAVRLGQSIQQDRLYSGLLSQRQAIRLESGSNDIKAQLLFPILERLHMSADEFNALLTHEQGDTVTEAKPLPQLLAKALGEFTSWGDWPLTEMERAAITRYALTAPVTTLAQIEAMIPLIPVFPQQAEKIWRRLQVFSELSRYNELASDWCHNRLFTLLFMGKRTEAMRVVKRWQSLTTLPGDAKQVRLFMTSLTAALPNANAVYAVTDPMIEAWRNFNEPVMADGMIDNRRHILTSFGIHTQWRNQEIGAVARLVRAMPQAALEQLNIPEYLNQFPGLNAALKEKQATLDDFIEAL
ncbi:hypothetical protein [Lacticaseibacillus hulanensis]|uniref:hypothetical protein n=1 Tax=Lacticaseibacillus hulanensis TaxID=2493111 RepID=UPI000FD9707C|nr:hypothetical protein [Lacticaseibacillus hulanensis]